MSTGSAKQSKKQHAILNAARKLFVAHGIRRITIEEICRTAGASKMTFYRFYKNKDDIAIAVIDQIADRLIDRLETIMNQEMDFGDKMKAMILARSETTAQFSEAFFKNILDDNSKAGSHIARRRKESLEKIKDMFLKEQKQGIIRSDINIAFVLVMAEYFRTFMNDERLQEVFQHPADLGIAISDFYLYGIIGKKDEDSPTLNTGEHF